MSRKRSHPVYARGLPPCRASCGPRYYKFRYSRHGASQRAKYRSPWCSVASHRRSYTSVRPTSHQCAGLR